MKNNMANVILQTYRTNEQMMQAMKGATMATKSLADHVAGRAA